MTFRASAALIAALLAAASASAQMHTGHTAGMDMASKPAASQEIHTAAGTVKKADPKAGKVTLEHGPVASLKWPAMTMAFKVKDAGLWKKLEDGRKVEVQFAQQGKDYVVTAVK